MRSQAGKLQSGRVAWTPDDAAHITNRHSPAPGHCACGQYIFSLKHIASTLYSSHYQN